MILFVDADYLPFTEVYSTDEKTAHAQYMIYSYKWKTAENNGNTFLPGEWYSVHDDIWDKSNWELIAEDAVLAEYE